MTHNDQLMAMLDCTTTNTTSAAGSFPMELVEMVLRNVPVPQLVIAAAHLPTYWRLVIEYSPRIQNRITRYDPPYNWQQIENSLVFFKVKLFAGTLLVHWNRKHTAAGCILCSNKASQVPLKVLDLANSTIKYNAGARFGYGFVNLRDFDGMFACSKEVSSRDADDLWEWVVEYCAAARQKGTEQKMTDAEMEVAEKKGERLRGKFGPGETTKSAKKATTRLKQKKKKRQRRAAEKGAVVHT